MFHSYSPRRAGLYEEFPPERLTGTQRIPFYNMRYDNPGMPTGDHGPSPPSADVLESSGGVAVASWSTGRDNR